MNGVVNPFGDPRRARSEDAAYRAEQAHAAGDPAAASQLFAEAAALEEEVAREVPASSSRLKSVLAISAVALWYKAGDLDRAKSAAYRFLAFDGLTEQGRDELERLVDRCSREREVLRLAKDTGMIPVEVKLAGGRVGVGYAPASAARKRRDEVAKLLMRSAEIEAHIDYRDRGESDLDRNDQIQIFEVPAIAASYGLRFYIATGTQQQIAPLVTPESVVKRFLAVATAAAEGPEAIRAIVPDEQYANAFAAGFAEIAPDGADVQSVVCSAPTWKLANAPVTTLEPKHRQALRGATFSAQPRQQREGERTIQGVLDTVHLSQTGNWIEIEVPGRQEKPFILVDDGALQMRCVAMRGALVKAFVKWNERRRRDILNAIERT